MGQDIKSLRTRIKSVDSTLHLTKAMGLVASSKMRRANEAMRKSRDYSEALTHVISQLTGCAECRKSPYLQDRGDQRVRMVVLAGDRGLAGGYNANIFRLMREYPQAEVIPVGKRSCERYGAPVVSSEHFSAAEALEIAKKQCADFAEGKFDRLYVVCTEYVSMLTQTPRVIRLLPLPESDAPARSAIFEPDELTILDGAVPTYVAGMLVACARESFACEVAARRAAMDSAGKNAQEMIDDLQLSYNRARQGAITQEITEIVAGSGNGSE